MMRISSSFDRWSSLLPYGYTVHTRARTLRDNFANFATSWIPGLIGIYFLTNSGVAESLSGFAVGYLAFICIYEAGYFVNDTIGVRRDVVTRDRLKFPVGPAYVVLFFGCRLAVFLAVLQLTGMLWSPVYIGLVLSLSALIFIHNMISRADVKFATFIQMSVLRFFLPVCPALLQSGSHNSVLVFLSCGVFCFTFPRLLTYQVSKGRLSLPERSDPGSFLALMICMLPIVLSVFLISGEFVTFILWAWMLLVGGVYRYIPMRSD